MRRKKHSAPWDAGKGALFMLIQNGTLFTESGAHRADIRTEGALITEIDESLTPRTGEECLDAESTLVTAGFVDIHTHGGYGADFMDATDEAFARALAFHADNGTTTVVPTSCTAPTAAILRFLSFTRGYMARAEENTARVAGVHLEGPYLSVAGRGAQSVTGLKTPARDDYSYMTEYADVIRTVTLSPELEGAAEMAKTLTACGILVSGGHDDGIYPEFLPAIEGGMRHLTHLFCAMSELRFKNGVREVGLREYALTDDALTAEVIADDRHIPPTLLRLIVRAKGADRVCAVSDSLRCAGMPKDGRVWTLGSGESAVRVKIGEGVATLEDGSRFAGSITPVREMVKNMIDAGISPVDAVKMGTLTPARILGIDGTCGCLAVGRRADLCVLHPDFSVKHIFINGKERTVWKAK